MPLTGRISFNFAFNGLRACKLSKKSKRKFCSLEVYLRVQVFESWIIIFPSALRCLYCLGLDFLQVESRIIADDLE